MAFNPALPLLFRDDASEDERDRFKDDSDIVLLLPSMPKDATPKQPTTGGEPQEKRWALRATTQPQLNLIAGLAMYANFITMAIFYNQYRQFQVFTFDVYRSGRFTDATTFISSPLLQMIGTANICIAISAFPLITANFHFLLRAWSQRVLHMVHTGAQWLRWVEYSISASTMLVALSIMCGVLSVDALIGVFGCYMSCMLMGAAAEDALINRGSQRRAIAFWYTAASFVFFFLAWTPPVVSFFVSLASATEAVPVFVYVAFFMLLASNCLFPAVFVTKMVGLWRTNDVPAYLAANAHKYENAYVVLSFASKQGLAWNIFGAAFQVKTPENVAIVDPGYSQWMLMVVAVSAVCWVVSAVASWHFNGSLWFLWGHLSRNTSANFKRLYARALALAAPLYTASMVLGIIALRDTNQGAIAALLLAASVSLQCVYFPCAENALRSKSSRRARRTLSAVLFVSAAAYAGYVAVACVFAVYLWARIAIGAVGGTVVVYMFLFDGLSYTRYALA